MRVVVVNVNALSGRKCAGEGGMEEGKRRACRQKGASGEFFTPVFDCILRPTAVGFLYPRQRVHVYLLF